MRRASPSWRTRRISGRQRRSCAGSTTTSRCHGGSRRRRLLRALSSAPTTTSDVAARAALLPFKESLKSARRTHGPGRRSCASESVAKYVLVDMFGQGCRGDSTKDVIATAASQLRQILPKRSSRCRRPASVAAAGPGDGPAALAPAYRSIGRACSRADARPGSCSCRRSVAYPFFYACIRACPSAGGPARVFVGLAPTS